MKITRFPILITLILWGGAFGNPALDGLGDNSWIKLAPGPSQRYIPRNAQESNTLETTANPVGRSYSGIHYGNGKIFYFGGGHGSYPGNDVEIYDIENNVWAQQYKPEVCPMDNGSCSGLYGGGSVPGLTPLDRPWVQHTYDMFAWDAPNNRFIALLKLGTAAFNLEDASWTYLAGRHAGNTLSPVGGDIHTWIILTYNPDLDGFPGIVTASSGRGTYLFKDNKWTKRAGGVPSDNWTSIYGTYIPDRGFYIVHAWGQFWKYDAVQNTWTGLADWPSMDSFDYDTQNKILIGIQHSSSSVFRVFAHDFNTDQWTQLSVPANRPNQPGGRSGMAPLLRYDPVHNVFIFLKVTVGSGYTGGITETWVYRYKSSGSTISDFELTPAHSFSLRLSPNPLYSHTCVEFNLPHRQQVVLNVYNLRGSRVASLHHGTLNQGNHRIAWQVADLPAGTYLVKMKLGDCELSRRMIILK